MVTRSLILLAMVASILLAQEPQPQQEQMNLNDYLELAKEDLAVQSKKLMLVNMQLSEKEGNLFWPIYDEYFAERSKIMDKRLAMYKMIAEKYGTLTNDDASKIAKDFFEIEKELMSLEKATYEKIADQLAAMRGVQFLQIQRQIDLLVRLNISSQFPLLK